MISYQEALKIIQNNHPMSPIPLPTKECNGLVIREDIISNCSIPPFRNSAMDGFAVLAKDIENASPSSPITLQVTGYNAAGDASSSAKFGCCEIMTGAVVPDAFDSVVKVEDVDIIETNNDGLPKAVRFSGPTKIGNSSLREKRVWRSYLGRRLRAVRR